MVSGRIQSKPVCEFSCGDFDKNFVSYRSSQNEISVLCPKLKILREEIC